MLRALQEIPNLMYDVMYGKMRHIIEFTHKTTCFMS